jgi:hypothetical protein
LWNLVSHTKGITYEYIERLWEQSAKDKSDRRLEKTT